MKRLSINISDEVHQSIKEKAIKNKKTIHSIVTGLLMKWLTK